jgi:putative Mn2+ efflux pump MntP
MGGRKLMLKLLAFVFPLGLDTFAVAAAVGVAGTAGVRARIRLSLLFVVFEAGMPLIGLALGAPLAHAIGDTADYVAAAAVIAVGAWILLGPDGDGEEERAARLTRSHGLPLLGLGVSISLDELAIGFSLGLAHLPVVTVIVAIALQTLLAVQLGIYVGARVGERFREGAERLAGIALIALGVFLITDRLLS